MKLYRHPPRTRAIKLSKNIHAFTVSDWQCPISACFNQNGCPNDNLWRLIKEVKSIIINMIYV